MKNKVIPLLIFLCSIFLSTVSPAVDWNWAYGMGNLSDDPLFSGSGQTNSVRGNVLSNCMYYITSAAASGAPRIGSVLLKEDSTPGTCTFYVATNSFIIASNSAAATGGYSSNVLWLTGTNSAMATNDIMVYQNLQNDSYQLYIPGGGGTEATGTWYTNALGQVGVKSWITLTNNAQAGDKLWKMMPVFTFIQEYSMTNGIITPYASWLQMNNLNGAAMNGQALNLAGHIGVPSMILLTYSNTANLFVSGDYYRRTRNW
jgi:hypothetical protein